MGVTLDRAPLFCSPRKGGCVARRRPPSTCSGRAAESLIFVKAGPFVVSQPALSEAEGNHERAYDTGSGRGENRTIDYREAPSS
jgi:hypothetical protein